MGQMQSADTVVNHADGMNILNLNAGLMRFFPFSEVTPGNMTSLGNNGSNLQYVSHPDSPTKEQVYNERSLCLGGSALSSAG